MHSGKGFQLPSTDFLDEAEPRSVSADNENLRMQSKLLEKKLEDFGVNGRVVAVSPGPVITTFEYEPAPGIKINKVVTLSDDLALALRSSSIRIVAPIPGKAVIGIEVPNANREMVKFREVVVSSAFEKSNSKLTLCLGKDIVGNPVVAELDKMPHLLIAGATGTGKSVALNAMICSLLYKAKPDEAKIILVDPKRIELTSYDGIPHLITPVVTSAKKATNALFWAVREMEKRYELLSEMKARNVQQYNQKIDKTRKEAKEDVPDKLAYIVVVIDELADLMMLSSRDVEVALTRLAQMARAAGIHLILATQRPSVDVLTGIIKANFPTRLTFQVSSKTDSRTIIDTNGAENLLGNGDMLFLPPGTAKLQRIHGAYISEAELNQITKHLRHQEKPEYDDEVTETATLDTADADGEQEYDERYDDALALIAKTRQASISMIQRHLRIGYNRAARIIEIMEKEGIVGPADGAKPRDVLISSFDREH
jgi:S-DNA-T family DNA segregation ATPase FtsK/SpoIIIE